jgi:magnesium-transporting ATPase (P-type)
LGVDPEADDVMAHSPRKAGERAIDARMWWGVVLLGLVMALATLFTIDLYLPGGFIQGDRSLDNARTAGFTVLVLAQLFNCFNARSETASAFHGLFTNRWMWGAVLVSVVLQLAVIHLPWLNQAFGTRALDWQQWGVCAMMASAVLWCSELRKLVLRRSRPSVSPTATQRSSDASAPVLESE